MATLAALAARTATGASATGSREGSVAATTVVVTAVAGTNPTLVVTLEGRLNDGTWVVLGTTPSIVAAGTHRFVAPMVGQGIRCVWTIGGTGSPSFTFSVSTENY